MGKLSYLLNVSVDGYIETPDHGLDWSSVDDELHSWFNDRMRETSASLYGRRLYELMSGHWPYAPSDPNAPETEREFGRLWLETPKIVFSSTLERVDWNSRLVPGGMVDVGDALARLRSEFDGDLEVAGPNLAGQFVRRGLVDEYGLVVHPVAIGAGTPYFPPLAAPIPMRLLETHTFTSGVVYLRYEAVR